MGGVEEDESDFTVPLGLPSFPDFRKCFKHIRYISFVHLITSSIAIRLSIIFIVRSWGGTLLTPGRRDDNPDNRVDDKDEFPPSTRAILVALKPC